MTGARQDYSKIRLPEDTTTQIYDYPDYHRQTPYKIGSVLLPDYMKHAASNIDKHRDATSHFTSNMAWTPGITNPHNLTIKIAQSRRQTCVEQTVKHRASRRFFFHVLGMHAAVTTSEFTGSTDRLHSVPDQTTNPWVTGNFLRFLTAFSSL